jgi:hypothetical protein
VIDSESDVRISVAVPGRVSRTPHESARVRLEEGFMSSISVSAEREISAPAERVYRILA